MKIEVWYKANIPIKEHRKMLALIKACHESYRNIPKPYEKMPLIIK